MLLSRPFIKPDECLVSYLIRVSEKNGFKHIGQLLDYAGLNWKNNRAPIHQILTGAYDLRPLLLTLGLKEAASKVAPSYQLFRRVIDTPYILVKFPKVCPECLEELGYCPYYWSVLSIVACPRHKKMLVDVSQTSGKTLGWYRQYLNRFDGENFSINVNRQVAQPNAIQQSLYMESLLIGEPPSISIPNILQGLKFRESLSLIHFICHYQTRLFGRSFIPAAMPIYELSNDYDSVWKMLKVWPDSFYSLLSQYVEHPMSRKGQCGLNKHFRDLYERLHRQKENEGIARIKTEFDRYVEQYWPGVLDSTRINRIQLTSSRNIISKKDAASILGVRLERVDKLVGQGRITLVVFKGKAHYLRDQVEAFANEISSNWTMAEACKALEVTRYQLKQLLDAGIVTALQAPDSLNRDWVVDKVSCISLVGELRSNARKSPLPARVVSIAGVQHQGYSLAQLVTAMQAGELEYSCTDTIGNLTSLKQFVGFKFNR